MSTGINAIVQKETLDGKWRTVLSDAITLGSSSAREFNELSQYFITEGIPDDLEKVRWETRGACCISGVKTSSLYVDGEFLGDHSIGYFLVSDLMDYKSYVDIDTHVTVDRDERGYNIFVAMEDEEFDVIKSLQTAFRIMFWEGNTYRVIVGYDS